MRHEGNITTFVFVRLYEYPTSQKLHLEISYIIYSHINLPSHKISFTCLGASHDTTFLFVLRHESFTDYDNTFKNEEILLRTRTEIDRV